MRAGIGMVTQEFSLVETMTVAENIALSAVGWGRVDAKATETRVLAAMERVGVHIDPQPAGLLACHRRAATRRDRQGALP